VHAGPGAGHLHAEAAPDREHRRSGLLSWLPRRGVEPAGAGRNPVAIPSARLARLDPGYAAAEPNAEYAAAEPNAEYATAEPNAEYATAEPNAEYAALRVDEHDHSYDPFPRASCSTQEVGPARFAPGLLREAKAPGDDSECIRTARARAPPATGRPIHILLLSS
jgi:hypothetical protein